ncbi:hypothetical protein [Amycolatopsis sp. SID8362]|uniref:hypothetical protein n=1 Tax=Amycolatopsis sp. SID8362 TaxID=2690346 RepID=UPI00136B0DF6|nr:hypothetical protein [Amycolatopsis sp. SID8362]NBH10942.1 hypothetical protein [Amycolatopsis sp. SID8362]NED47633.1 hypothetical protein [Amycolatopsis sp. SID8362]
MTTIVDGLAELPWTELYPYLSVAVLKCRPQVDPHHCYDAVWRQLHTDASSRTRKHVRIVATAESPAHGEDAAAPDPLLVSTGMDQVAAFVRESTSQPAWAGEGLEFFNTTYELNLVVRRGGLIAVKPDNGGADRFQKWIDRNGASTVERIKPLILEYTFLQGEAKGLWLHGASGRTTRRPDAKTSVGMRLQDTLDEIDDGAYSLSSARCELPRAPGLVALTGRIGSTLSTSQLWLKPMENFELFLHAVGEIFDLIEAAEADPDAVIEAFPQLAREVSDLSEVRGAYDVSVADLDQLPSTVAEGEELQSAAELLQNAVLRVVEGGSGAKFKLDVGLDGTASGTLGIRPEPTTHGFRLSAGFSGEPAIPATARRILDAIDSSDLLSVYYESGHVYSGGRISKRKSRVAPFRNWRFKDFHGTKVSREKPFDLLSSTEIHRCINVEGDDSLFRWVARNWNDGWLICDDGSGEIADFLHIGPDGTLRLIQVKGAESHAPGRRVSTSAYEAVAAQASKNLLFFDKELLISRLTASAPGKASWVDGKPVTGRNDFIECLRILGESDRREVIIVQPHLTEAVYQQLRACEEQKDMSAELLRFRRLELLLNLAYSSVVKAGAELLVFASK